MPKVGSDFDGSQYAPVTDRITLFYDRFPRGRIVTRLVSRRRGEITFMARVYRAVADTRPASTGWATERVGDGEVNSVACLENAETSAIGRVLANLGFTASRHRPSLEEMAKAARARARLARGPAEAEASGRGRVGRLRVNESDRLDNGYTVERRSQLANATVDTLRLLQTAERAGLDPAHVRSLHEKVRGGVSLTSLERVESVVRKWLVQRSAAWIPPAGTGDVKDISL